MGFKNKFLAVFLLSLLFAICLKAAASSSNVDGINHALNSCIQSCNESCSYYAGEHNVIGIGNTLLTLILLIAGTVWLFLTYKKKFLIVIGILLGLAVLGSYFYPKIHNSKSSIGNCPVLLTKSGTSLKATDSTILAPTSQEFVLTETTCE